MADKIDLSLDEIIKSKRGGTRGRGRGRNMRNRRGMGIRNNQFSNRGVKRNGMQNRPPLRKNSNEKWQHDLFNTSNTISPRRSNLRSNNVIISGSSSLSMSGGPGKLLISNLDFGVTDSDIQELFGEFGPLLSAAVHYDRTGRSLGTADVIFERKMDGIQAIKKYNNVPLDGRPMNIQMATSDISLNTSTLITNGSSYAMNGGSNLGRINNPSLGRRAMGNGAFGGRGRRGGAARGGARRGGGGRGRRAGPKPTADQLDAELDTYNSQMET